MVPRCEAPLITDLSLRSSPYLIYLDLANSLHSFAFSLSLTATQERGKKHNHEKHSLQKTEERNECVKDNQKVWKDRTIENEKREERMIRRGTETE